MQRTLTEKAKKNVKKRVRKIAKAEDKKSGSSALMESGKTRSDSLKVKEEHTPIMGKVEGARKNIPPVTPPPPPPGKSDSPQKSPTPSKSSDSPKPKKRRKTKKPVTTVTPQVLTEQGAVALPPVAVVPPPVAVVPPPQWSTGGGGTAVPPLAPPPPPPREPVRPEKVEKTQEAEGV